MSTSSIISRTLHESIHEESIHAEEPRQQQPADQLTDQHTDQTTDVLTQFLTDMSTDNLVIGIKHRWYLPLRAVGDWMLAVVLLVIAVPIVAVAALVVKRTSPGPAFYRQNRVGKNGRIFSLIKLRTMVDRAEALSGPVWAKKKDTRITPVGRFLRNTHLDEFPQLLNVVLGQMSLIGPRPERPEFVAKLEWELPQYRTRLKLRPGITGLPQLLLDPDTSVACVRRKLVCDLYYVRYVSPWLDFKIFCATAWHLLKMVGSYIKPLVSLPNSKSIHQNLERYVEAQQNQPQLRLRATSTEDTLTE